MLLPIVGRKQLVELFAPKMFEALISHHMCKVRVQTEWNRGWLCMWAGLVIITIKEMMVFKSEACAAFIYASTRRFLVSMKRNKRMITTFLYYFEVSHVWLDARPSNFDGRHSITPRFYPCKVPLGCQMTC